MTMLTNPFTFGFWLWLAYPVGNLILGEAESAQALAYTDWTDSLQEIGGPVLLGMGIFGVGGATLGYLLVKLCWQLRVALRRHKSNTLT